MYTSDLASKISVLEEQLEDLRRQKMIEDREIAARTPDQNLAIALHETLCNQNHTDGCGWFYEVKNRIHNWNGAAHQAWLGKARKISAFCEQHGGLTPTTAVALFSLANTL